MAGWNKGQSGNPGGRRKEKIMSDALYMELASDPLRARRIADRVLKSAEAGDMVAAKLIFDRLEGKAIETVRSEVTVVNPAERMARLMELSSKVIDLVPDPPPPPAPRSGNTKAIAPPKPAKGAGNAKAS
jgi:Family of unknown function (DUF5681)